MSATVSSPPKNSLHFLPFSPAKQHRYIQSDSPIKSAFSHHPSLNSSDKRPWSYKISCTWAGIFLTGNHSLSSPAFFRLHPSFSSTFVFIEHSVSGQNTNPSVPFSFSITLPSRTIPLADTFFLTWDAFLAPGMTQVIPG